MTVLPTATLMLAACGDAAQTDEEEIEAVYERFVIAEIDGDAMTYCDSVVLLSGRDVGSYTRTELQESLEESDQFCEPELSREFERRGDVDGTFEVVAADVTVNGYKARARFTVEADGKAQQTSPRFVNPTGDAWRVAFTGY